MARIPTGLSSIRPWPYRSLTTTAIHRGWATSSEWGGRNAAGETSHVFWVSPVRVARRRGAAFSDQHRVHLSVCQCPKDRVNHGAVRRATAAGDHALIVDSLRIA